MVVYVAATTNKRIQRVLMARLSFVGLGQPICPVIHTGETHTQLWLKPLTRQGKDKNLKNT